MQTLTNGNQAQSLALYPNEGRELGRDSLLYFLEIPRRQVIHKARPTRQEQLSSTASADNDVLYDCNSCGGNGKNMRLPTISIAQALRDSCDGDDIDSAFQAGHPCQRIVCNEETAQVGQPALK